MVIDPTSVFFTLSFLVDADTKDLFEATCVTADDAERKDKESSMLSRLDELSGSVAVELGVERNDNDSSVLSRIDGISSCVAV
mmetsp:Transcript_31190/g.35984  ORF Transcript_31190/g.35984 Transcript_31190/m.35984 type:complete len:83 (-) Transcript_31190:437-685(-)